MFNANFEKLLEDQQIEQIPQNEDNHQQEENEETDKEMVAKEIQKDGEIDAKDKPIKKGIELLETSTNVFDLELFIKLLEKMYPFLREELVYCAPEMIYYKIKQLTGVNMDSVMDKYNKYRNEDMACEGCAEKKETLKRKFIASIYKKCTKKHC